MINNQQIIDDAWLGISVDESQLFNPMDFVVGDEDKEHLIERIAWLMMRPEYFSFACKHIMNIELSPFQALILAEVWNRKFPMLIGSRGLGKLLRPNEKIRVKNGWKTMENIVVGDKVYGSDGKLCNVIHKTDLQKNVKMYKITLRDGRTIDCCEDHMWKVWSKNKNRGEEVVWSELKTKDMAQNFFWVRKDSKSKVPKLTKEYRYALPVNMPLVDEEESDLPIHPYVVGVLLGDGTLTGKQIVLTSLDQDLIERFESFLPEGYKLSQSSEGKDYRIIRKSKDIPAFHHLCKEAGIWGHNSHTKFIPEKYRFSSYAQKLELIKGLMDTDGYSSKSTIEYYTVSDALCSDFIEVLRSLGISCRRAIKQSWFNKKRYADCHRVRVYTDKPVFSIERKLSYLSHVKSKAGQSKYEKVFITNIEQIENGDGYCIQVDSPDKTYITKDYIVTHNSFLLSVYALLRALFMPRRKIIIVGAAFRQSKVIFEYMDTILKNAPVLRDLCGNNSGPRRDVDRCVMYINDSIITALPLGDGQKIRGQRAHDIISDEFASIPRDIFENVVAGFAAVSSSPIEKVKQKARDKKAKELGINLSENLSEEIEKSNQIVLSGTAYYDFNHFADYWKRYKAIINSKGDPNLLKEVFGEEPSPSFDWREYSIIRIPVDKLPEGFMDEGQISRAKATIHSGIYNMEYSACFTTDSQGFFKRSLLEACTCSQLKPVKLPSGDVHFGAMLRGDPKKKYIFGVDPASEVDNFSIVVIELNEDHRRIVHSWTTTRQQHKNQVKSKIVDEDDFYSYCAKKIRSLMRVFPCVEIAIDTQGGGIAVIEALHDKDKMERDEVALWPIIDEDKPKDTDDNNGLHILRLCQFAKADWLAEANHGMRKDFEDKVLLFPFFDSASIGVSIEEDKAAKRVYDTLEDCVMEIEELKDELSMIVMTQTGTGRERWDTPEIKVGTGKKSRLRKDRYSSLLMANMSARSFVVNKNIVEYGTIGGFARSDNNSRFKNEKLFYGPNWFTEKMQDVY